MDMENLETIVAKYSSFCHIGIKWAIYRSFLQMLHQDLSIRIIPIRVWRNYIIHSYSNSNTSVLSKIFDLHQNVVSCNNMTMMKSFIMKRFMPWFLFSFIQKLEPDNQINMNQAQSLGPSSRSSTNFSSALLHHHTAQFSPFSSSSIPSPHYSTSFHRRFSVLYHSPLMLYLAVYANPLLLCPPPHHTLPSFHSEFCTTTHHPS
ncbi:hypothetical protein Droror1_Dr00013284 [Drosera rotundifolia]